MGGGKGGGDEAAKAREDEQARQERIRQGTARVNSIFDGSTVGDNKLAAGAAFDPNAQYFLADGSAWSPTAAPSGGAAASKSFADMLTAQRGERRVGGHDSGVPGTPDASDPKGIFGTGGGAKPGVGGKTPEQQFAEMLAGGKLFGGTKNTGGFNDEFFSGRKQAYIDYANPQLEDQRGKAEKELTFALARGGLLDSSVRGEKAAELQQLYDINKQKVADEALGYESQARNSVEDARSNLIATLNATGDAQGAANSALARAGVLSQPAAFSPLSNLFGDFTAGLGTQAALERANYYSGGQSPVRYKTGLFTPGSGSVAVT